ncbi:MAG: hypothetical protein RMI04_00810 [Thermofilaceae archaeon]|nr:hypothetical protein [Thermofilaceae archaeon]
MKLRGAESTGIDSTLCSYTNLETLRRAHAVNRVLGGILAGDL